MYDVIMYGVDMLQHFQTVFAGDEDSYLFTRPVWLMWFAAIVSLAFPFLNGPIEEIMYRGYAQPIFFKYFKKVWIAIVIPSLGFALQHVFWQLHSRGQLFTLQRFFFGELVVE
ncbi:CPBP family intramembrane metalloprotease [Oceanobacillus sp. 143]|nr:CPBP family intramembrane metalloprotease [Oceanobacillus sp. 143]